MQREEHEALARLARSKRVHARELSKYHCFGKRALAHEIQKQTGCNYREALETINTAERLRNMREDRRKNAKPDPFVDRLDRRPTFRALGWIVLCSKKAKKHVRGELNTRVKQPSVVVERGNSTPTLVGCGARTIWRNGQPKDYTRASWEIRVGHLWLMRNLPRGCWREAVVHFVESGDSTAISALISDKTLRDAMIACAMLPNDRKVNAKEILKGVRR